MYGAYRICSGVLLLLFAATATVMFGALLGRVPDPYPLMGWFHVVYAGAIVLSIVCGILGIAGGLAVSGRPASGRLMLIIASLLALSDLPVGIAFGVYTLIVLLTGREVESLEANRNAGRA